MMKKTDLELSKVQWTMQDYDLDSCKMIAQWIYRHIKLHETDFTMLDAGIKDICLSNRAYNVLKENGIVSLQELLILTSQEHRIRLLKGAGKTVTNEIEEKVRKFQNTHIFKSKNIPIHSTL